MRISRQALYTAVWEKPVRTLARQWGLSDVGLAKACRKHDIPLPPMGHWAKVAVGRGTSPPRLSGDPEVEVEFHGDPSQKRPKLNTEGQQRLKQALAPPPAAAAPTADSAELARWTKKTAAALSKTYPSGFAMGKAGTFQVSVGRDSVARAVALLNTLERSLTAAGMEWGTDSKRGNVVGKMYGETIDFGITEKTTRTEHIKHDPRYEWMKERSYTYDFSGDLTIRIDGYYEGRKSWSDGKTQRLEERMPEVVEGFLAAAEALRKRTVEMEAQRQRWAEEARQREERERIAREEKAFLEAALAEAENWKSAQLLREYVAHLKKELAADGGELSEEGKEWLEKLERAADRLDPANGRLGRSTDAADR